MPEAHAGEVLIAVSACLVGEEVRYDGTHKKDPFIVQTLGRIVQLVPVCPEVGIGLGTPREPIHLVQVGDQVRLVGVATNQDHTAAMIEWARRKVRELERLGICGFILKKDSPSCGMERVRIHRAGQPPLRTGRGLFAQVLMEALPLLPVEEEGRLHDPALRENFFERVFAYRRLRELCKRPPSCGELVRFHTAEKMLLLAHDPQRYRELGRLVANAKGKPSAELCAVYQKAFMEALRKPATRARHTNVLLHMLGHLKHHLTPQEKQELLAAIGDYGRELVPLVVPITLVRHFVRRYGVSYLEGQTYLEPHPKELMLRNHV